MFKTPEKLGIIGTYLSITNVIHVKHKANILNGEKPTAFPVESEQDTDALLHHLYST